MESAVPHVPLTPEKKEAYYPIIIEGNKVLLKLFRLHGNSVRKVLKRRKITRNDFRAYMFKILKEKGVVMFGSHKISQSDLDKIEKVHSLEWEIICSFGRAFNKIAKYWSSVEHNTNLRFDDFYQEAICGLINALYCYEGCRNGIKIQFTTYAFNSINNKIRREINNNNPLSHLTQKGLKLYQAFLRQQKTYSDYVTFDKICQDLKLSPKEIKLLDKMLVRVQDQSSLLSENKGDAIRDYSTYARDIENKVALDFDQIEAVKKAPFTKFEAQVFYAYLIGGKRWQTEVAENSFNPKTGKPYSKQAVKIALDNACRKVKESYFKKGQRAA